MHRINLSGFFFSIQLKVYFDSSTRSRYQNTFNNNKWIKNENGYENKIICIIVSIHREEEEYRKKHKQWNSGQWACALSTALIAMKTGIWEKN